ncbi:MAG: hypothetical protein CMJ34_05590 [Phycisphaerae bacterium]|nr:hypothetical protein [Phycisphaerae bacterium]
MRITEPGVMKVLEPRKHSFRDVGRGSVPSCFSQSPTEARCSDQFSGNHDRSRGDNAPLQWGPNPGSADDSHRP